MLWESDRLRRELSRTLSRRRGEGGRKLFCVTHLCYRNSIGLSLSPLLPLRGISHPSPQAERGRGEEIILRGWQGYTLASFGLAFAKNKNVLANAMKLLLATS